jgi:hypothetical protein
VLPARRKNGRGRKRPCGRELSQVEAKPAWRGYSRVGRLPVCRSPSGKGRAEERRIPFPKECRKAIMEEEIPAQESEDAKNIYESGRTMENRSGRQSCRSLPAADRQTENSPKTK